MFFSLISFKESFFGLGGFGPGHPVRTSLFVRLDGQRGATEQAFNESSRGDYQIVDDGEAEQRYHPAHKMSYLQPGIMNGSQGSR
jgi:hypothetical protein